MKKIVLAACLVPAFSWGADLTTTEAFNAACKDTPPQLSKIKDNTGRQLFTICQDLKTVQQVGKWAKSTESKYQQASEKDYKTIEKEVHNEIVYVRDQLKQARMALEKINLKPNEGLRVKPSTWQTDIDGDGKIETWEQYFFAVPQRGHRPFAIHPPENDPEYYSREYNLDAQFKIDQSDILWTLAYHHFAEGLLELLSAYRVDPSKQDFSQMIYLTDKAAVKRAHVAIGKGFTTSLAMSQSVLAEKDDDEEWIANPSQKSTVFPIPLEAEDFATWQTLLKEVIPAWKGDTLLVPERVDSGALADLSELCPKDQGLNIAKYFSNPHKYPVEAFMTYQKENRLHLPSGCEKVTSKKPKSGIFDFLRTYSNKQDSSATPGANFIRHLYWVN